MKITVRIDGEGKIFENEVNFDKDGDVISVQDNLHELDIYVILTGKKIKDVQVKSVEVKKKRLSFPDTMGRIWNHDEKRLG